MEPEVETHVHSLDLLITEVLWQPVQMHTLMCSACGSVPSTPPSAHQSPSLHSSHYSLSITKCTSPSSGTFRVTPFVSLQRKMLSENSAWEGEILEFCLSLRCRSWWCEDSKTLIVLLFVVYVYTFVQGLRFRGQLGRTCSLLPSWPWAHVNRLGCRCLYPLTYLTSLTWRILWNLSVTWLTELPNGGWVERCGISFVKGHQTSSLGGWPVSYVSWSWPPFYIRKQTLNSRLTYPRLP